MPTSVSKSDWDNKQVPYLLQLSNNAFSISLEDSKCIDAGIHQKSNLRKKNYEKSSKLENLISESLEFNKNLNILDNWKGILTNNYLTHEDNTT